MSFDYSKILSSRAGGAASPWNGYPPYHFVGGNIDEPSVPVEGLIDAVAKVMRGDGHDMAKYGMNSGPLGYLPLREFIVANLKSRADMTVTTDEVLVTTGSLQAMDLINEALLEPGDMVVLEGANYGGALGKLRRMGVEFTGVDLDEDGMRMDHLREVMTDLTAKGRKPKFIYTIPTVQNPTGTVMSRERRLEMLDIAREFDVAIFEDDCYSDLVWENPHGDGDRPPAIHALDTDGRVVYCASFSKTVAPALRMGYIVAPWSVMRHILPLKTDGGSGALEQMVLSEYLPAHFDAHVEKLLPILKAKATAMTDALDQHFGSAADYSNPIGGNYIWVTLPENVDTRTLAAAAGAEGIAINPGPEWSVDGDANKHRMRLCFGHPDIENIKEGVAKLAEVCHREFGVPLRSANVERG